MMEARYWSDVNKGPWAKEFRQPLEGRKGKKTDSPLKAPEETTLPTS